MTEAEHTHTKEKETVVAPEDQTVGKKKSTSIVLPAALIGSIVLVGFLVAAFYLVW